MRPDHHVICAVAATALGMDVDVEQIQEGLSTYVYRLLRSADTFYLRVLPEEGATFAPEAEAHGLLRSLGVRVPEVVYWDDRNPMVDRSVMITAEIKGRAVAHAPAGVTLPDILRAAGRDLALMNQVRVNGFGWIRRNVAGVRGLRAELGTEREFMLAELEHALHLLHVAGLGTKEVQAMRTVIHAHEALLDGPHACLAHGDFDTTHIFANDGGYTGIIDLGEIRGTGPYYDLGHFRFHDGEQLPVTLLPHLLAGYQEVAPLGSDADRRITLASLLIGIHFLARTHGRLAKHSHLHALAAVRRDLEDLVV